MFSVSTALRVRTRRWVLGGLGLILSASASAEVPARVELDEISGQSQSSLDRLGVLPVPGSKRSGHVLLNLDQQQYPSDGQIEQQRKEYTRLGVDAQWTYSGKQVTASAHGMYQGTIQSGSEQYAGLPELYVGETQSASGVRLTVGRQKRLWSRFDDEFGMGIWQPQLRWDYLNPVQQGLTGIFLDYTAHPITVSIFTSSLFLPDQGPAYSLKNGEFSSQNRWFWKPQTRLQIFGQRAPMYYEIEKPKVEDVLFQSSIGGSIRYQQHSPFWAQISYAYKPMNQLHLAVECTECVGAGLDVQAKIHAQVLMHRVVTAEAGLEDENQRGWVSITSDVPTSPKGPADWIQSAHESVLFAGASYAHYASLASRPGWFKISYLQAFAQRELQPNSVVDERVESSLDRYPYQQIAALEWNWLLLQKSASQVGWRTRYTYSIPERGSWLSSQLWLQRNAWNYNLGFDIIGAEINPTSSDAGLFSRYRANDRVVGGVSYVF